MLSAIAALSSSDAPSIPPRFGWIGAAAFTGTTGSTQRITGGWQASWPTLAAYQSIELARRRPPPASASIAFSSSCFART